MLSGLRDYFRKPAIRDRADLSRFLDENAAFVTQKGIYEYSRARAGHYAKVLFREQQFLDAVELARWRGFPLGLAMVAEVVAGVVEETAGADRRHSCELARALALSVFDGYSIPAPLGAAAWQGERTELDRRLTRLAGQARRRSFQVPDDYGRLYLDIMPIHPKLKASDYLTTVNYLKLTLCNIHIELTKRLDAPRLDSFLSS